MAAPGVIMEELTARQQQVLDFIGSYVEGNGYPPSLRDICAHLGIVGNAAVLAHLRALERKGRIRRDSGNSRGIVLSHQTAVRTVPIPIVGVVRAGTPEFAYEDIEGYYPLDSSQLHGGAFFLRVKGDSMINDAIIEGDLVLIRPQSSGNNGDIIVALIAGEATLKRFYREKDHIRLQPRNPNMEAIIVPAGEELTIIGKAVKVVRDIV